MLALAPVLLAGLALAGDPAAEPPQTYTLTVGDQTLAVQPGTPARATVNGQPVPITLLVSPNRVFDKDGITFAYPSQLAWEYDPSTTGLRSYTLDGNTAVVMVQVFDLKVEPGALHQQMLSGVQTEFAAMRGEVQAPVKSTLQTADGPLSGDRVRVSLGQHMLQIEIYTFTSGGRAVAFMLQDSVDDRGRGSAEMAQVHQLLADTLRIAR